MERQPAARPVPEQRPQAACPKVQAAIQALKAGRWIKAKTLTPVGDPIRGHIKSTLRIAVTQRAGMVRAGNSSKPYGGVQHYGWPARNIKAQPWLAEAAKATEPYWVQNYYEALEKILKSVHGA